MGRRPPPDPDPIVVLTVHLVPGASALCVLVAADRDNPPAGVSAEDVNDALGALVSSGELAAELAAHWTATRAAKN